MEDVRERYEELREDDYAVLAARKFLSLVAAVPATTSQNVEHCAHQRMAADMPTSTACTVDAATAAALRIQTARRRQAAGRAMQAIAAGMDYV